VIARSAPATAGSGTALGGHYTTVLSRAHPTRSRTPGPAHAIDLRSDASNLVVQYAISNNRERPSTTACHLSARIRERTFSSFSSDACQLQLPTAHEGSESQPRQASPHATAGLCFFSHVS
jgi:hypothetical protein